MAVPLGLLLGLTAVPLLFLIVRLPTTAARSGIEWSSLLSTLGFAAGGASAATMTGAAIGALLGMHEFRGRRLLLILSLVPIAAPPAFWWIGLTRLTSLWGNARGPVPAAVVAGLSLAPVSLLLVMASVRQMPSNLYEAARVALPPAARIRAVLIPQLGPSLTGAFVLIVILLLGESELPFLFGFRTLMTDVITTFSQTFDVGATVPIVAPLLVVILMLGLVAAPLMKSLLRSSRGEHGIVRRPVGPALAICAALPAVWLLLSAAGYSRAVLAAVPGGWPRVSIDATTIAVSILEPVGCAWMSLILVVAAAYPARQSRAMAIFLWMGLLLFCIPAAVYAIGWLAVGRMLGGLAVPPALAHTSRAMALATLGFVVGYTSLPRSLEDAATLVGVSPARRAFVFMLPLVKWSLVASSALIAALVYADRDVGSLLLAPGASRLMLNFYLASANAPSATIGVLAVAVIVGAALTLLIAAAGPGLVRWRNE